MRKKKNLLFKSCITRYLRDLFLLQYFTYFDYSSRSYIDHILVSEGIYDNVISCAILPHIDDNITDHRPVKVTLNVVCDNGKAKSDTFNNDMYSFSKIDWSNTVNQTKYLNSLSVKCTSIEEVNIDLCGDSETAQSMVNRMNDQIVSSIHDASICVAGPSTDKPKQLKQRPWWTASTKLAKNRKSI